ncbi:hypothetical protein PAAG_11664 [Paracoccidioides lutzii Pb01]|uniref:Uncharacterized protein n=1 Tax=Paracoccidioides lutzii (strain ATCC MYA-826 / Pb01) TaxID=502779 RepID=A0A0A2V1P0_PARBA|nr:hypothetical protein PAAG_11664 [Paracoccidioides lutzii Pb01]KGQ01671.1 hypothetical protein PAAG_11664 [Paracoccidioides lutzii Pb01]
MSTTIYDGANHGQALLECAGVQRSDAEAVQSVVTEGLEVVCKDATAEKVDSMTLLAVEKAVQSSAKISHADTNEYPWSPTHGRRLPMVTVVFSLLPLAQVNSCKVASLVPASNYHPIRPLATVVSFMVGKVRVVQATCDPSNQNPTLPCTLRGSYDLSMSCYNKSSVRDIVKWILCPPELAQGLPLRGKEA